MKQYLQWLLTFETQWQVEVTLPEAKTIAGRTEQCQDGIWTGIVGRFKMLIYKTIIKFFFESELKL